jgi:predicted nucleotidyltransferase
LSVVFFFLKRSTFLKNKDLQSKVLLLEAKLLENKMPVGLLQTDKKFPSRKGGDAQKISNSSEIFSLRKENSKLKDHIKKYKEELKIKEKALKEEEHTTQNKLYSLTQENSKLILQMKEIDLFLKDQQNLHKKQLKKDDSQEKNFEFIKVQEENSSLKQKFLEVEKIKNQLVLKLNTVQDKLKNSEYELEKWVKASRTLDGKIPNPHSYVRWYERALVGRKMYRLMRQMRELSDSKVLTYQEGVIELSKWILQHKGLAFPEISAQEISADRFLAEAWSAIQAEIAPLSASENVTDIPHCTASLV